MNRWATGGARPHELLRGEEEGDRGGPFELEEATEAQLRRRLLTGEPLWLERYLPVLQRHYPELAALSGGRGRPAEATLGHTQQVMDLVQPELRHLPVEQAQALYLAALLHNIGWGARGAASQREHGGAPLARDVLYRLDLPGPLRDEVVYLVRSRNLPVVYGWRAASLGRMLRLAWTLNTRLLYLLAAADCRALELPETHRSCRAVAAFRERCETLGVFGREPPPLVPPERWRVLAPPDPRLRRRVAGELRLWRVKGRINTPAEAAAWLAAQSLAPAGTLYLPVGVPGSGKSTWLAAHVGGVRVVSMDEMRERLTGNRGDQSRNPEVYRRCRAELARALRGGEAVIWDAQSHTWSSRQSLLALARESHAYVIIVYFDIPLAVALARNPTRPGVVPEEVIVRSYGDLEEPRPFEADELWRVDVDGHCARYVGDEAAGA